MGNYFKVFCVTIFIISCKSDTYKGRQYYFPVEHFIHHPTVYRYYSPVNDSIAPEIWLFKGIESDSGIFLESTLFEAPESIVQTSSDKMADNGAVLRQIALFLPDSTGKILPVKGEILESGGYLFSEYKPNELTLLKIRFSLSDNPKHLITLTRARQFRRDTTILVMGRTYPARSFNLTEHVDDEQDGHLELTYSGYEVFAQGLGRVYYKKAINANNVIEFLLKDTLGISSFKRQSGDQIPLKPKNE